MPDPTTPDLPFDPLADPRGFLGGPDEAALVQKPPNPVDLSTLRADREITQKEQVLAEEQLDKTETARIAREEQELKDVSARMKAAEGQQMQMVKARREAVDAAYEALPPQNHQKPLVDSKDFQNFSMMLTGIALIGGAVSKNNWLGVQSIMNGAMEGYLDGDREKADREYQRYRQEFDSAYKQLEASQKDFEEVVYSTSLPINQLQREFQTLAALHGREDALAAARAGRIDKMRDRVAHYDEMITKFKQQDEKLDIQWRLGLARMRAMQGGISALTPDGRWAVETIYFGTGNRKPAQDIMSRFGGITMAYMWNDIGKFWKEHNVDPRQWTAEQMLVNADQTAMRFTKNRQAQVNRIAEVIKSLEPSVVDLIKKVNGTNPNLANKYFNTFSGDYLGDFNIQKLTGLAYTVGREFQILALMPGSNAQMHVASQEFAEKLVSRNFSLQSMLGGLAAINIDIKATSDSFNTTMQGLQSEVINQSMPTPPAPGLPNPNEVPGAPPPTIIKYDQHGTRQPQ